MATPRYTESVFADDKGTIHRVIQGPKDKLVSVSDKATEDTLAAAKLDGVSAPRGMELVGRGQAINMRARWSTTKAVTAVEEDAIKK